MAPLGDAAGVSMVPTTPPGLTVQGTILGTLQYMAPEQLEWQDADRGPTSLRSARCCTKWWPGKKRSGHDPVMRRPIGVNERIAPAPTAHADRIGHGPRNRALRRPLVRQSVHAPTDGVQIVKRPGRQGQAGVDRFADRAPHPDRILRLDESGAPNPDRVQSHAPPIQ
jgi:hypothetical protein